MNSKIFFKALSFGLVMSLTATSCGKKKNKGNPPEPVVTAPAPVSIPSNVIPTGQYPLGGAADPYVSFIANQYQAAYGSIVFVNPIQCGNGNTIGGTVTWAQFYSSCVVVMAQPFGSYWGNFNYGNFFSHYQNTFFAWQQTAVYVTGGYATGGRSMNVSLFSIFNTFVANAYNTYYYYMPAYYGGYYNIGGYWPYYNSHYCGNLYYGSGNGWSLGFNISGFWN